MMARNIETLAIARDGMVPDISFTTDMLRPHGQYFDRASPTESVCLSSPSEREGPTLLTGTTPKFCFKKDEDDLERCTPVSVEKNSVTDVEQYDSPKQELPQGHWRQLGWPLAALLFYYFLGFAFYHFYMDWGFIDCIYFSTVLMMTVGYGDLTPDGDLAFIFTACYAMLAFTLVATAASRLLDWSMVVRMMDERRKQKKRMRIDLARMQTGRSLSRLDQDRVTLPRIARGVRKNIGWTVRSLLTPDAGCVPLLDDEARRLRNFKLLIVATVSLFFWIALGTIVTSSLHDIARPDRQGLVKGFYFSVITLTTVGFGEIVPETMAGKVFDIFYILVGVPICVNSIAQFVAHIWGEDKRDSNVEFVQGLSGAKLRAMLQFQQDMNEAGCGNAVDARISRYEFLLFVLARNEMVEMDTIKEIMDNFHSLDEDASGFLSFEDVDLSVNDKTVIQSNKL